MLAHVGHGGRLAHGPQPRPRRRPGLQCALSPLTAWPLAARAQQPTMPVIGILGSMAAADFAGYVTAFREGLDEADFVEGQNVAIEYRWANNQRDNYPKVLGAV